MLAVALALALGLGGGGVSAQYYYETDPVPEPAPGNDILPPATDGPDDGPIDGAAELPPETFETIPPSRLRIASWDLGEAPHLMPQSPAAAQVATWRTSFGSERRTEEVSKPAPASDSPVPDADIILLQGVTDIPALRRLLPARQWRLVVSRRALTTASTAGAAYPLREAELPVQVTAIAIRARRGLRITGREPAIELAISQHAPASATAVRIADGTRMLWLLSVALPDACAPEAPCAARSRVAEWQQGKRGGGEVAIVGGHLASNQMAPGQSAKGDKSAAPRPAEPCRQQAIDGAYLNSAAQQPVIGAEKEGAGCMALTELPPS